MRGRICARFLERQYFSEFYDVNFSDFGRNDEADGLVQTGGWIP